MTDKKADRRGLGRGLSALMADVGLAEVGAAGPSTPGIQNVPVDKIAPNPEQPRRHFNKDALEELAASLREKGVLQPLILRESPSGFEIVAGERRWRAAQIARLHMVPAIVRNYTDTEVLEIAIIENIQRADLNPIEEALAFRQLIGKFGHTQEKVAESLGKSRSYIANSLRLLALPDDVIGMVQTGALSAGHARALVTSEHASVHARRIVDDGLTVRDAERLVREEKSPSTTTKRRSVSSVGRDADTIALEKDLSASIGMQVRITLQAGTESGQLSIRYTSFDDLDKLCQVLGGIMRG